MKTLRTYKDILPILVGKIKPLLFFILFIFLGISVARADITTGLLGYWTFDEGSGTSASDSSNNGHNGTLSGSTPPSWVAGKAGPYALSFDGSSSWVSTALNPNSASVNQPETGCAWVYGTGGPNNSQIILSDVNFMLHFMNDTNDGPYYLLENDKGAIATPFHSAVLNTWQHVCGSVDANNNAVIYVNGVQAESGNIGSQTFTSNLEIGAVNNGTSGFFRGDLDDVRFYNRVLSPSDVMALYNYAEPAAPIISNIAAAPGSLGATITWTTNKAANSTVNAGQSTAYGLTFSSDTLVTSHSIVLTGLVSNTIYHFQVTSTDPTGDSSSSSDLTFTTNPPPVISAVNVSSITPSGATIKWTTNEGANSTVNYGLNISYGTIVTSTSFVTSHAFTLTGLSPNTVYHFQVTSADPSGALTSSNDGSFTTLLPYYLIVSTSGRGSGTISGGPISCPSTCYTYGESGNLVTLTALPAAGSRFTGWTGGGCSDTGTCTVTVSANVAVTADFALENPPDLIPAARMTDWTPGTAVGVPGGIPTNRTTLIDVTQIPYNADNTGATDTSAAIQAAMNAAQPGDVVYLPAGIYRIGSTLSWYAYQPKNNVTIRGAGMDVTNIDCRAQTCIMIGTGDDYLWNNPSSGNTITAGLTQGSTQITIADTSAFTIGGIVKIKLSNDFNLPVISVSGYPNDRNQTTRVTAKTATTLSLFPPLYGDYSHVTGVVYASTFQANNDGIENMTIDMSNGTGTFGITLEETYGSWVNNVKVSNSSNYGIMVYDSLNDEIRHSYFGPLNHTGTNGAGILFESSSGCLVEDNIVYKSFPEFEINFGSSGNVFAYNFLQENNVLGIMGASINANHGPHNAYNLYEGNIASVFQSDGYFGGDSEETLFRNWFHATDPQTNQYGRVVDLDRFSRNYSIVGNILGMTGNDPYSGNPLIYIYDNADSAASYGGRYIYYFGLPNVGNPGFNGTYASLSEGFPWRDMSLTGTLTTRTDNGDGIVTLDSSSDLLPGEWSVEMYPLSTPNNAVASSMMVDAVSGNAITLGSDGPIPTSGSLPPVGTAIQIWPGQGDTASGFQQLDLDVRATTILEDNWNAADNGVHPSEALASAQVLPNSLFRSVKPSWFNNLAWPPFDPANPNQSFDAIPAGYRYDHNGEDPPSGNSTYGDVNGDGNVTIYDAELTAQYAIGIPVANFNAANAQVDGTDRVDIYDAFLIAEYAVGIINKFPVQQ